MKGYTIQHSIELLEKQAGSGSGEAPTAAQVSYDNTGTGLVATDVQAAISELDGSVVTLTSRGDLSTSEVAIGKVGNDILYRKMIDTGALPNNTVKTVNHEISNLKYIYSISGTAYASASTLYVPIPGRISNSSTGANITVFVDTTKITLSAGVDMSNYDSSYVILEYTKTAPLTNTRSKKAKKEE